MKKFISGLIVGIGISACTAVFASDSLKTVLFPSKVTFHIKGQSKQLDVNEENPVINYNNKAYIPLRLFSEFVGADVEYRQPTIYSNEKNVIDIYFHDDTASIINTWTLTKTAGFMDGMLEDIAGVTFGKPSIDFNTKSLAPTLQFKNSSNQEIEIKPLQINYQIVKVNSDGDDVIFNYNLPVLEGKVPASSWYNAKLPIWEFKKAEGNLIEPGKYAIQIVVPESLDYVIEGNVNTKTLAKVSKFKRWEYDLTQDTLDQLN